MADIEKIREEVLPQLFNELQRDKIPLKIQLTNNDTVHSTYITDIRKRKKILHFLAKYPPGFQTLTKTRTGRVCGLNFLITKISSMFLKPNPGKLPVK